MIIMYEPKKDDSNNNYQYHQPSQSHNSVPMGDHDFDRVMTERNKYLAGDNEGGGAGIEGGGDCVNGSWCR